VPVDPDVVLPPPIWAVPIATRGTRAATPKPATQKPLVLGRTTQLSRTGRLGQLPFTGLALWLIVALSLTLIGTGARFRAHARV